MSLYTELLDSGTPLDHHESELYARRTADAIAIVTRYRRRTGITVNTFKSQLDGHMWYDIPFGYEPFWTAKHKVTP